MLIQVLGMGCKKCDEVYTIAQELAAESGREIKVEKVTDMQTIARMGVFATPSVAVDGKVVFLGRAPSRTELKAVIGG